MRTDISSETIAKTSLSAQTPGNDAQPQLSLVVARKETMLTDIDFTERRRVAKTTLNTVSDLGIAVCHPKLNQDDSAIYIVYVQNNNLYLRWSKSTVDVSDMDWEAIDLGVLVAWKCDIGFKSWIETNARGETEYVTSKKPLVFFLVLGSIYYIDLATMEIETIVSGYAKDLTVRQTPAGLGLFYAKTTGGIFYKILSTNWSEEQEVGSAFSGDIEGLSSFQALDGFGLQIYSDGKIYRLMGTYSSGFTWGSWDAVLDATGTGAIVEYYDSGEYAYGKREAFFDANGFKYADGNPNWTFNSAKDLYPPKYAVIEFDHTNQGTVYFANLMHRETTDVIYFFRYVYMKDVSNYVSSAEKVLQVDNAIQQINATLKNINGTLFIADSTLFAPSSMMRLGVRYGSSELVSLGFGYIDEVNYQYGGKTISLSGRNVTGALLNDQTLDEPKNFVGTPSAIIEELVGIIGNFFYEIDERSDYVDGNPRILDLTFDAETTGLEVLEALSDLLTNESAGNQWKVEENYEGVLICGFDDFRAQFLPKGHYTFNGRSDVFAESIDRCIDGVYTSVRCTGITPKGKEIAYTYPVKTFRFWTPGDHRTYHAPAIEGITKDELKAYAKALAKELKYAGRVMTYKMNLKPQLLIGDVAEVTYGVEEGDDPEMLGSITEITHTMGERGYFTEFTLTSGGNINNASVAQAPATRSATPTQALVYVAESGKKGTNRITRLADFLGMGNGKNTTINATTINQIINGIANFPELIRNIGFRLLDEPTNVQATYDENTNAIKLKWTDPLDISTSEPVDCEWVGTVVVRSANGEPLNRWDGTLIEESTTRNEYSSDWLVDDTVEKGTVYYYAIMPYDTKGDYRYTKVVQIQAGGDIANPTITSLEMGGASSWDGSEVAILYSGDNNSLTVQIANSHIIFKLYSGNTEIYNFTSPVGSGVADVDKIHVSFLKDNTNYYAKPSFIYETAEGVYSYNQESPSNSAMGDIYGWLGYFNAEYLDDIMVSGTTSNVVTKDVSSYGTPLYPSQYLNGVFASNFGDGKTLHGANPNNSASVLTYDAASRTFTTGRTVQGMDSSIIPFATHKNIVKIAFDIKLVGVASNSWNGVNICFAYKNSSNVFTSASNMIFKFYNSTLPDTNVVINDTDWHHYEYSQNANDMAYLAITTVYCKISLKNVKIYYTDE